MNTSNGSRRRRGGAPGGPMMKEDEVLLIAEDSYNNNEQQQRQQTTKKTIKKRRRRRRSWTYFIRRMLLQSRTASIWDISIIFLVVILLSATVFFYVLKSKLIHRGGVQQQQHQQRTTGLSLEGTPVEFQRMYNERNAIVDQYTDLYNQIYKLSSERLLPPDETEWPDYERGEYELKSMYGPNVEKCTVTIVVTDPRLTYPLYLGGPGQPIWFALESIGAYAPTHSCVVLQTSTCPMEDYLGDDTTHEEVMKAITESIYENSLPLFRRKIESGYVRLTILDYKKYNLMNCNNYGNPTPAYVNRRFWDDEFIDDIDNDLVMIFQGDTALCYPLEISDWNQFAFVGSVWPRKATPLTPEPMEGSCLGMPSRWNNWLLPQHRWKRQQQQQQQQQQSDAKKIAKQVPEPKELLSEEFPKVCENGRGPVGNGGLSIRSRKWLIKAIEKCPHVSKSGLGDLDDKRLACKVFEQVNEDFYFGTILAGIDAPLPSAYDASLFATEMLWPQQVWDMYDFPPSDSNQQQQQEKDGGVLRGGGGSSSSRTMKAEEVTGSTGKPFIWLEREGNYERMTIPNGVHKPWWYHSNDLLRSDQVAQGCKFLQYIFTPEMSRYDELNREFKPWVGVGT